MTKEEKKKLKCKHCHESGHEVEECFKLHGIPDWYKRYKENRERYQAHFVDNAEDSGSSIGGYEQKNTEFDMSKIIQAEISKYMSTYVHPSTAVNQGKGDINCMHQQQEDPGNFDGYYAFSVLPSMEHNIWVIDSGASTHVCYNPNLLTNIYQLKKPIKIHLPDGTSRLVNYGGVARLNNDITLTCVLFVPEFTHNLISIAQLIQESGVRCLFYKTHCVFQKEGTDAVLGMGKLRENLYIYEEVVERHFCNLFRPMEMSLRNWHTFLGHPSISTMKHLPFLTEQHEEESFETLRNCEICLRAKQTRNPFPQLQKRSSHIF